MSTSHGRDSTWRKLKAKVSRLNARFWGEHVDEATEPGLGDGPNNKRKRKLTRSKSSGVLGRWKERHPVPENGFEMFGNGPSSFVLPLRQPFSHKKNASTSRTSQASDSIRKGQDVRRTKSQANMQEVQTPLRAVDNPRLRKSKSSPLVRFDDTIQEIPQVSFKYAGSAMSLSGPARNRTSALMAETTHDVTGAQQQQDSEVLCSSSSTDNFKLLSGRYATVEMSEWDRQIALRNIIRFEELNNMGVWSDTENCETNDEVESRRQDTLQALGEGDMEVDSVVAVSEQGDVDLIATVVTKETPGMQWTLDPSAGIPLFATDDNYETNRTGCVVENDINNADMSVDDLTEYVAAMELRLQEFRGVYRSVSNALESLPPLDSEDHDDDAAVSQTEEQGRWDIQSFDAQNDVESLLPLDNEDDDEDVAVSETEHQERWDIQSFDTQNDLESNAEEDDKQSLHSEYDSSQDTETHVRDNNVVHDEKSLCSEDDNSEDAESLVRDDEVVRDNNSAKELQQTANIDEPAIVESRPVSPASPTSVYSDDCPLGIEIYVRNGGFSNVGRKNGTPALGNDISASTASVEQDEAQDMITPVESFEQSRVLTTRETDDENSSFIEEAAGQTQAVQPSLAFSTPARVRRSKILTPIPVRPSVFPPFTGVPGARAPAVPTSNAPRPRYYSSRSSRTFSGKFEDLPPLRLSGQLTSRLPLRSSISQPEVTANQSSLVTVPEASPPSRIPVSLSRNGTTATLRLAHSRSESVLDRGEPAGTNNREENPPDFAPGREGRQNDVRQGRPPWRP